MTEFRTRLKMIPELWLGCQVESIEGGVSKSGRSYARIRFVNCPYYVYIFREWSDLYRIQTGRYLIDDLTVGSMWAVQVRPHYVGRKCYTHAQFVY